MDSELELFVYEFEVALTTGLMMLPLTLVIASVILS